MLQRKYGLRNQTPLDLNSGFTTSNFVNQARYVIPLRGFLICKWA